MNTETNSSKEKAEIKVPSAGESITEADIAQWMRAQNDWVEKDELILEIETEKASLEIRSPEDGKLTILKESGTVKIGEVVGWVEPSANHNSTSNQPLKSESQTQTPTHPETTPTLHPTPASRKLLQENNLNADQVVPSGRGGRIMKEDVMAVIQNQSQEIAKKKNQKHQDQNLNKDSEINPGEFLTQDDRKVVRSSMSRIRKTIAKRLVESQQTAALLTTFNEVDMSEVIKIRQQYKELFKKQHEINLGFMSFFVKSVCEAVRSFPLVNSMIQGDEIVSHAYVDVGVAVSTPKGLIVPVIKNAQTKSFEQIEKTILDFSLRGKEGKIDIDEMTGGTFTITNGGVFGSMLSTPIVNFPQSAILGMHSIVKRPIAVEGEVVVRPIMYLALSYDHRLIDGADAVKFLYRVKELIEDPHRLLIQI